MTISTSTFSAWQAAAVVEARFAVDAQAGELGLLMAAENLGDRPGATLAVPLFPAITSSDGTAGTGPDAFGTATHAAYTVTMNAARYNNTINDVYDQAKAGITPEQYLSYYVEKSMMAMNYEIDQALAALVEDVALANAVTLGTASNITAAAIASLSTLQDAAGLTRVNRWLTVSNGQFNAMVASTAFNVASGLGGQANTNGGPLVTGTPGVNRVVMGYVVRSSPNISLEVEEGLSTGDTTPDVSTGGEMSGNLSGVTAVPGSRTLSSLAFATTPIAAPGAGAGFFVMGGTGGVPLISAQWNPSQNGWSFSHHYNFGVMANGSGTNAALFALKAAD